MVANIFFETLPPLPNYCGPDLDCFTDKKTDSLVITSLNKNDEKYLFISSNKWEG